MSDFTFAQVPRADIPRSTFNRSHGHKTTFDAGYLVPIYVDEALPGDTFKCNVHMFARLITPLFPIMDNIHLDCFFFAVPNRLLWDNWQRFNGEQPNPGDTTDFEIPSVNSGATGFAEGSLFDYMGLPIGVPNLNVNVLPLRAYNLIYNEWFRDQNLCDRMVVPKDDGPDLIGYYTDVSYGQNNKLLKRGKRHDYFTSCLPWPQKGDPVSLPLGTMAPVLPDGINAIPTFARSSKNDPGPLRLDTSDFSVVQGTVLPGQAYNLEWDNPHLVADLNNAAAATINAIREAFQVQKLLERDARGGTRYTEILRSHFGVISPDARLQRPEFLGGDTIPVVINPVAQTSGTAPGGTGYTDTPQGNLAAFGQSSGRAGFTKSFTEHCYIIGLIMARADLSYQQGLHKMWTRKTRFDFYWPALAHLGEQPVYNQEIYAQDGTIMEPDGITPTNEAIFGYQERWAEYRYAPSKITGKFRSTATDSLDPWHLAQHFTSLPVLGRAFIEENPPIARITVVQSEPQFLFDSHFRIECTRPMPTYSVPGLVDHF